MEITDIRRFLDELIKLRLPRTPDFSNPSDYEAFCQTWARAFYKYEIGDLRAVWGRLVDRCKYFPTIPEIKEVILEFYGSTSQPQFAPRQLGVMEREVNGRKLRIESRSDGYTITHIDGEPIFPAVTVLKDFAKIDAIGNSAHSKRMPAKLNVQTLKALDHEGREVADLSKP